MKYSVDTLSYCAGDGFNFLKAGWQFDAAILRAIGETSNGWLSIVARPT